MNDDFVMVRLTVQNAKIAIEQMLDTQLAKVRDVARARIQEAVDKFDIEEISQDRITVAVRGWIDRQINEVVRSALGDWHGPMQSRDAKARIREAIRAELRAREDDDHRWILKDAGWHEITYGKQRGMFLAPGKKRRVVSLEQAWRSFTRSKQVGGAS